MKISFITNLCAHYNIGTFDGLAQKHDIDYFFFSAGNEWYWQKEHGSRFGNFHCEYLKGFNIGQTRVSFSLIWKLMKGNYDVYIKCINGRFALPITFLIARLKQKPFILWTGIWTRIQTPFHRLFFPVTKFIYTHSDAIVVYGEHTKQYLISEGVLPEKIFIAAHAVENKFYGQAIPKLVKDNLRKQLNINENQKVILYLGRLEEIKGLPYLLNAFSILNSKDTVLVLAGEGSLKPDLLLLANQIGIQDKIRFVGYVPPEKSIPYYAISDVFVLPSITTSTGKELWGLVINEAFNQGIPVIATDAVGASQGGLVKNGKNGLVIPEKSSEDIAKALHKILTDTDLHSYMCRQALDTIEEWNYERNVLGYLQAIDFVNCRNKNN